MIYLSIQSVTSLKENSEFNGSVSDPKISSELKALLERYAKMLGFTLSDAIDRVLGILGGQKSSEVWLKFKPLNRIQSLLRNLKYYFVCNKGYVSIWCSFGKFHTLYVCQFNKELTSEYVVGIWFRLDRLVELCHNFEFLGL